MIKAVDNNCCYWAIKLTFIVLKLNRAINVRELNWTRDKFQKTRSDKFFLELNFRESIRLNSEFNGTQINISCFFFVFFNMLSTRYARWTLLAPITSTLPSFPWRYTSTWGLLTFHRLSFGKSLLQLSCNPSLMDYTYLLTRSIHSLGKSW